MRHGRRVDRGEVKAALVAETSANLTRVRVVSVDGVVHLSGTVADSEQPPA